MEKAMETSETDFCRQSIVSTDTTGEYFIAYRSFLDYFAKNVDPTDQLPVRVPNYQLTENEITGAVIDWMIQYLTDKKCPQTLVAPIIKLALEQTQQTLRKSPELYGCISPNEYQPLKLMQLSISKINDVCQSLLDNLELDKLIPSPPAQKPPLYSAKGLKNTRRHMEDRHIVIDDFNAIFGIKDTDQTSYYAIFDGHGGTDAAAYCVSHLHCEIAASKHYPNEPAEALREAFILTDDKFIEKSKKQKLQAGSTALCALYRMKERQLYVGWVGDSKALLVSQNRVLQIVNPHKPDSESERKRIESSGGCVLEYPKGCFRVNGRLAVSRAIGDYGLKDVVIGDPDIVCLPLNGNEDFLILACDGLWDYVEEDDLAVTVYEMLEKNEGDVQPIAGQLIELAKKSSSSDNISVIAVFLKDPKQIVAEYKLHRSQQQTTMDFESTNGLHHDDALRASEQIVTDASDNSQQSSLEHQFNTIDDFKMHVDFKPANEPVADVQSDYHHFGNNGDEGSAQQHMEDITDEENDDFGPETDVDATDDAAISPLSPSVEVNEVLLNNALNADIKPNFDNGYDFIESAGNAVMQSDLNNIVDEDILKKSNESDDDIHQIIDDNRFVDHVQDHLVTTSVAVHAEHGNNPFDIYHGGEHADVDGDDDDDDDDDKPELGNKIDFSEKKEYSFEREEYKNEFDPIGVAVSNEIFSRNAELFNAMDNEDRFGSESHKDDDEHDDEYMDNMGNAEIATAEQHVLPTNNQVTVENVVVVESGDDSDDEWDYIQVNKDKAEQQEQQQQAQDIESAELVSAKGDQIETTQQFEEVAAAVSSAPLELLLGEEPQIAHAVAQAFAEPEEACTELIEEKQESEFNIERVEHSASVADHEFDNQAGVNLTDEDDDDMESQLNPDAKEFVPVSPQRTMPAVSPFNNGIRHDLLDDDVVSQSPRKGSAVVMDDIVLPSENDFSEISKRPAEIELENGGNALDVANVEDGKRPESSSSQCSYQEMNLKEAMHGDEKQELQADTEIPFESSEVETNAEQVETFARSMREQDPMHMSFYDDGTEANIIENNPFKAAEVDLNAVQPLPDDVVDDDELLQNKGEHFETQTPSNNNAQNELFDLDAEPVAYNNQQSSPQRLTDMVLLMNEENAAHDELAKETESESEKIQSAHFDEQPNVDPFGYQSASTITQVVQEMATEVTSLLDEFKEQHGATANGNATETHFPDIQQFAEPHVDSSYPEASREVIDDVINKSDLSISANEFTPNRQLFAEEADQAHEMAQIINFESNLVNEPVNAVQGNQFEAPVENSTASLIAGIMEDTNKAEVKVEPEPQQPTETVAAIGVVAATTAVAAAAVTAVKSSASAKTSDAKKPGIKVATTAKKPLASTTTASKPSARPSAPSTARTSATSPTKAVSKVGATAPKVASRTTAPKAPIEKKTTTTTTTSAARKPLSNGVSSTTTTTVKKTTVSTSAVPKTATTRPVSATSKLATTARTTTSTAPKSTITSKVTTTTAAPRVPLTARSTAKPSTVAAAKPKVPSATATSSVASRVRSAPAVSTARTTTLTKPKTTASADKPLVSSRTTTVKTTSPIKSTTTTVKKIESTRSPISKSSTSTLKSSLSATSATSSLAAKKTTPTRKSITLTKTTPTKSPKVPATNGIAKKPAAAVTKKTVTETVTTNGATNAITEKLNGLHIENGGTATNSGDHAESLTNGNNVSTTNDAIIDLSAD